MRIIVHKPCFLLLTLLIILLNTFTLSLDKYPSDKGLHRILEQINHVFTLFFLIEMICKIIAFSFK